MSLSMRRIWWLPGTPLLPPADHIAPVRLKRKRDVSAAPQTEPAKRAYRRTPDEAKLWFQDFHVYQARVHGKNIRRAKHLVPELFGPVAPDTFLRDGMKAAHLTTAADHPWICHHSPCRVSRTLHMPSRPASASASPLGSTSTAVCCASSTSNSSPADDGRGSFCAACSSHGNSRRLYTRSRPSEADIARERKLLQLRVIYLCDRFGISQDRIWILDETAVRIVPAGERGWSKRAEPAHVFASRAFVTVTLAANMRGGMWTQIVYEGKSGRVHPHGPHFPRQLVSHSPTHWITQEALLDMIDAIDADMHARPGDAELTPWLSWFWIVRHTFHCCGISQHHARHPAAHQTVLRPAELHGIHSAAGPGVHARFQELDPSRGSQTLRRVQLRACQSRLQFRCAPPVAAVIHAHSRTERRQPATSNRWLALHRLERGGAA